MKKFTVRTLQLIVSTAVAVATVVFPINLLGAQASTSISYDFNTAGDITAGFNSYVQSGTIEQSATGGINNSGAISVPSQTANGVFSSKASYSLGPVGSTYTFTSFLQSVGNSGYSGMGFTSLAASSGNAAGYPYRPTDALGVSVHGGGFVFHNGARDLNGSWASDNSGIVTVSRSTISDLLNTGSPVDWYKFVLVITRDSLTTFDMRLEVWSANADGSLIRPDAADAIFELRDQTNASLTNAPSINTYLNFSGDRVYFFDNYQVTLAGGSTVIQAGSPVVLTDGATLLNTSVELDGSVTATGGNPVTERGFVFSTSPDPTISNYKVASGSGTGSFTQATSALPNGTYYFRAYATNATGTSYGVTKSVTITGSSVQSIPGANNNSSTVASEITQLANTGVSMHQNVAIVLSLMFIMGGIIVGGIARSRASVTSRSSDWN